MKLTIVGSGGAIPTPRPFCQCPTCEKARKEGEPYKRNSSSLFIDDIFTLIDCGEDIGDSLNRRDIKRVDNLLITHWHPDHTYGLRPLMEAHFNFFKDKPEKSVKVYLPKKVLEDLKKHFPSISHFIDGLRVATLGEIEHGKSVRFENLKVTAVGYKGKDSSIFAYLLEEKNKRVLYAPCDTIHFEQKIFNLDLLITECGLFSYKKIKSEISFPAMMKRIKRLKPKKTILTHIEEDEINAWGWNYLNKMKEQYADVDFDFAYDGMEIEV
jgi:phosphoribosyl 1,2-cyclic phosphate phosphodiesterase